MAGIETLKSELEDAQTLKMVSQAMTEAAASHMQKIRKAFEVNTQFYTEVCHLYHLVRVGAVNKEELKKKKKKEKNLSVALTSNQRFYGNINILIMKKFGNDAQNNANDLLVIGTTGRDSLRNGGLPRNHEQLVFAKDNPNKEETNTFLEKVKPYESVVVYYPKFVSLVRQTVGVIDITQTVNTDKDKIDDDESYILFEPEYSKIFGFFELQVRALLFLRVLLESDLSRTSARLLTMSGAEERSNEMIKQKHMLLRKLQQSIMNTRLLETFSAIRGAEHV